MGFKVCAKDGNIVLLSNYLSWLLRMVGVSLRKVGKGKGSSGNWCGK